MAVNPQPLPKSTPDIAKLNTFSGHTVTVTKYQALRGVGQMVLPTQTMPLKQILELQTRLPVENGPGLYKFQVVDTGGTADDEWLVKLGPEQPQENYMSSPGSPLPPGPGGSAPLGEGVVHLGHGFYYNEALGTLTTPWRRVYNWKQGDPMPEQPTNAPHLSLVPPSAQPGQWPQQNWGSFPVEDTRVKELEARLARQDQQNAEDRRSRELAEMRADMQRQAQEQNARFEKLIEKLFTKPAGPSEETLALQRRIEQQERAIEEQRRRDEERQREDRLRAEMKAQQERFEAMFRELTSNKSDPMLQMLTQVMIESQKSAAEAVKAIQSSAANASTLAERNLQVMADRLGHSIMAPSQVMELATKMREGSDGFSKQMMDGVTQLVSMQRGVFSELLDVASQGQQPAWVTVVERAMQQVGAVGEALAKRQQQPAPPPPRPAQRVHQPAPPVQRQQLQPNGAPAQAPVAGEVVAPPAAGPKGKKGKKGAKTEEAPAATDPSGQKGYTIEQLREASVEDIRATVAPLSDEEFFGKMLLPFVKQIREQVGSGMKAEGAAEMLLRNRDALAQLPEMPPAVELIYADHIEVLIEHMLPAPVTDEYREAVVAVIETALEAESAETEE